jgi:hypothetical protein
MTDVHTGHFRYKIVQIHKILVSVLGLGNPANISDVLNRSRHHSVLDRSESSAKTSDRFTPGETSTALKAKECRLDAQPVRMWRQKENVLARIQTPAVQTTSQHNTSRSSPASSYECHETNSTRVHQDI